MQKLSEASLQDIPQLCDLLSLLFTQEAEFKPDSEVQAHGLTMIIGNPDCGRILVLRKDGRIVGMANLLYTVSTAMGCRVAILEDVVVHPDYRGRGLGHDILEGVTDYARTNRIARLTLLTDADNKRAQSLYEAHGFAKSEMLVMRAFPKAQRK